MLIDVYSHRLFQSVLFLLFCDANVSVSPAHLSGRDMELIRLLLFCLHYIYWQLYIHSFNPSFLWSNFSPTVLYFSKIII